MMSHIYQYVDTIFFKVEATNERSRRAVEKIGGILLTELEAELKKVAAKGKVVF